MFILRYHIFRKWAGSAVLCTAFRLFLEDRRVHCLIGLTDLIALDHQVSQPHTRVMVLNHNYESKEVQIHVLAERRNFILKEKSTDKIYVVDCVQPIT